MARATTSLPTPLSPCSNTVISRAATFAIRSRIACILALLQSLSSSVMDHPLGPLEWQSCAPRCTESGQHAERLASLVQRRIGANSKSLQKEGTPPEG